MKKYKVTLVCRRSNRDDLIRTKEVAASSIKKAVNLAKNLAFLGTSIGVEKWKVKFIVEL